MKRAFLVAVLLSCAAPAGGAGAATTNEVLTIDATDVPRGVLHAKLHVPLPAGGDVALVYPKWKPGNHAPTGQVDNIGMLRATAGDANVAWTRDPNDIYTFHFAAPPGATALDLSYDFYEGAPGGDLSTKIGLVDWNTVVFAPLGAAMHDVSVAATIVLPAAWTEATALPLAAPAAPFGTPSGTIAFAPVTIETLVDSPLYCGAYERVVPLTSANGMTNEVDLFGEAPDDIDPTPVQIARWKRLVTQADRTFGGRHYTHYHFLVTLSDTIPINGVEHHESSANRLSEHYLTDPFDYRDLAALMSHEFAHSWNGKYRRPQGLITKTFQEPGNDELLWVYEGLNEYLGEILATRSGLLTTAAFEENLAATYANLDLEPGRATRSLDDTAKMQVVNRVTPGSGAFADERRPADYYAEGELLWLDADTLIRTRSHGKRSLDDFLQRFLGGPNVPRTVVGYTRPDVIAALQATLPYDWATFFRTRVDDVLLHPEIGGIIRGGWKMTYTDAPTAWQAREEQAFGYLSTRPSLGGTIKNDGTIAYADSGTPLARAGIAHGAKILGVDGLTFTPQRLRLALRDARHARAPIVLIVDDAGVVRTVDVDYHGGERYPRLVRDPSRPDLLAAIAAPKAAR